MGILLLGIATSIMVEVRTIKIEKPILFERVIQRKEGCAELSFPLKFVRSFNINADGCTKFSGQYSFRRVGEEENPLQYIEFASNGKEARCSSSNPSLLNCDFRYYEREDRLILSLEDAHMPKCVELPEGFQEL